MIYLDYSATTFTRQEVLDCFLECEQAHFANANSKHALGKQAAVKIAQATDVIASTLSVLKEEIIYTSCASEANNLAIKGLAASRPSKKHIITSMLEHSSVIAPLSYLEEQGYEIDFVHLDDRGRYDLTHLTSLITSNTLCICLVAVDSETGIRQPIELVGKLAHEQDIPLICDMTQALGKSTIDLSLIDLATASAHKIYGINGIGMCIKKSHIQLTPQIHGGKSVTSIRSGTPQTSLIVSFSKAIELAVGELAQNEAKVYKLRQYLVRQLKEIDEVTINSNEYAIGHIVNMSVKGIDPDEWVGKFSDQGVYLTSKTACSGQLNFSKSVYAITKDQQRAETSLRISISHVTSEDELDEFIRILKDLIKENG